VPGLASARFREPLQKDSGRSFHSRGTANSKDLSPNSRGSDEGATRLRLSGDLREQERTF